MTADDRVFAHELYPHAEEGQTRPLTVEVPYLYAMAVGHDVLDLGGDYTPARITSLVAARRTALLADALAQGMTSDGAWAWADERLWDYSGWEVRQRAIHYGVPVGRIRSYRSERAS